jgi:hypothetical protein
MRNGDSIVATRSSEYVRKVQQLDSGQPLLPQLSITALTRASLLSSDDLDSRHLSCEQLSFVEVQELCNRPRSWSKSGLKRS